MGVIQHLRSGETSGDGFEISITPDGAGWMFTGLGVLALKPGGSRSLETGSDEMLVLPLVGSCTVTCDGARFELQGRGDVFTEISDFFYAPRGCRLVISSECGGRFALPSARARRTLQARHVPAIDIAVELRGAGASSRQVNNLCTPDTFDADRLISVEVLTPGGNCSSYPPHKHDADLPGKEAVLEEIYYFEVEAAPNGPGFGYQRVYSAAGSHPSGVCVEVRTGDVILVPHGYHGPSLAPPGYALYYLNVMAGPGVERAWRFTDDPVHAWIRDTWRNQDVDSRLPLATPGR